jgi:hypothetical protein
MGRDVATADTQHVSRFNLGAQAMTIPSDQPIQGVQLGRIDWAVFREGDIC